MKRLTGIIVLLVVALAAVGLSGCAAETYAAVAEKGEISVSGAGSVTVKPDVAYVTLGVSTQDTKPMTAQRRNNEQTATVIDTLKAAGIAESDIKTSNFYMYANYDYNTGREAVTGYTVSNTVTITVRDIDQVGEIMGAAADAGANQFNGVDFGLLDSSEVYQQALVLALENAAQKAHTLATAMGTSVGGPVSVTESGGSYAPTYGAAKEAAMDTAAGSRTVPVQSGELTITANVTAVYAYNR